MPEQAALPVSSAPTTVTLPAAAAAAGAVAVASGLTMSAANAESR